ncbi:MAG TPA: S8 family serine peptidase [Ideonella sp.]|uniref:S8 family serine peptidase n=1 Tax=Ideonella sp. TaxID=1929293 RepID=UPI002E31B616|nr:S8 family serine peptidase [Ideonella sp.]HEX5685663.1 S8 family serine peptidase [Ideonella sp.]
MTKTSFPVSRLCVGLGLAFAMMGAAQAADTTRVVVTFKSIQAAKMARAAIAQLGGKVKVEIDGENVAVELPKAAAMALAKHTSIARVEQDAPRYPLSLTTPSDGKPYKLGQLVPYGIALTQADKLKDTNASNRKICIIDSGYGLGHEDLQNNANVTGDDDIGGAGQWSVDGSHHGTHVAGTISAINNLDKGVVGVLPNKQIKLHIIKVFGDDGAWAYSSTLSAAAKKCQAAGANVISMSLGGPLPNATEKNTFTALQNAGILSIAAAGNGGNTQTSYPAGYLPVMSVAAVDEHSAWASFSQRNKDVEIAGPGVGVLSTVPMGTGSEPSLQVGGVDYAPGAMDGSPQGSATAALADFGLGDAIDNSVSGKVCLIQRGNIAFSEKVLNCQNSGGVGAVVYNNVAGGFAGTLGGVATTIPSVTASDTEGAAMKGQLGQSATVAVQATSYAYFDGTSMATPHVSAVAALVWSYHTECTGEQIRQSLNKSAKDLDVAGRDVKTGYGLVQAKAAHTRITNLGCGN